ncbi:MAG: UDP-N-acetylglucosamine 2-epimerase (non-hydrolyzing) [Methylococcales bacterium]|nr:UDP-N-acetylglucosamine 2-epimerase (non-hydrolyzing) [Methylococcales bacterium]
MEKSVLNLLTIVGARPQFIKAAVVSRALAQAGIRERIVHTGQHHDAGMSDVFFAELEIPRPAFHLGVHGGGHGAMTGAMLQTLEPLLLAERPDWVLVYGDTNSTLSGALAASKLHIPVAHVEAGLRSFNRRMPEEQNRIVTDHLSDLLFTPTDKATVQLRREGIPDERILQVGDVMYDAALHYSRIAEAQSRILAQLQLQPRTYVLATLHRAENTDDPNRLREIAAGLERVAKAFMPVVLPLHPRTKQALERQAIQLSQVRTIDPVGYLDMVMLERNAAVIATDSGGVQKEAYFHRVPCVTLRDETEWVELVEAGWNRLVGADASLILESIELMSLEPGQPLKLYGDGNSAKKIARYLHS